MRVRFFMDFDKGELHFVEMVLTNPAIYRESIFRVLTAPHEDEDSPMPSLRGKRLDSEGRQRSN